jgi:hypothetical protein
MADFLVSANSRTSGQAQVALKQRDAAERSEGGQLSRCKGLFALTAVRLRGVPLPATVDRGRALVSQRTRPREVSIAGPSVS